MIPTEVTPRILVVVAGTAHGFRRGRLAGWDVVVVSNGWQSLVLVTHEAFTMLLVDADLPDSGGASSLLVRAAIGRPEVVRWMMGTRKPANYDQLVARGEVEGFVRRPFELESFLSGLRAQPTESAEPPSDRWRFFVPLRRLAHASWSAWRRQLFASRTADLPRVSPPSNPRAATETGSSNTMPSTAEPPLSVVALVREVAERVRYPLAGARIDVVSAQTLLAPPSTPEQTALAIALIGNARAAIDRIEAIFSHLVLTVAETGAQMPDVPEGWGRRVLVVDDDDGVRASIGRMLAAHDVVALASPRLALERIAAGERFAFILSDLMMAEMTGDEFFFALARLAPEQAERFLFMSGGALTDDAHDGVRRAARPAIAKPFKPVLLLRLLAGIRSSGAASATP